jgi:hypothetical protein
MKRNLAVGQIIDLNVAINGGPVDESVIYELAPGSDAVLSINAAGNVAALNPGTGIVYIRNPVTNKILKKIVFTVYTPAQLELKKAIASGAVVVVESTAVEPIVPAGVSVISPTGMTGNINPYFTAYGSGSSATPYTVFNGSHSEAVCWQAGLPAAVGYKGQSQKLAVMYGIMPDADAYAHLGVNAPRDFIFQGSNTWVSEADFADPASTNWTTLDEQTNQMLISGNEKTYPILVPQAFKHYRLIVTKSNGLQPVVNIKELRVFGFQDHLISPLGITGPAYNGTPGSQPLEANGYTIYDANTYHPSGLAWNAFDNDTATDFWTRYSLWMIFQGAAKKILTRFEVTAPLDPGNEIPTYGSKVPKIFRLQGTNDWVDLADAREFTSTNWHAIDYIDIQGQAWELGETKAFSVQTGAPAYKHFRVIMSDSDHQNDWVAVSGFKLYGVDTQEETLLSPYGVWNYAADYSGNVWGPVITDAGDQNQVYVEAGGYRIYMLDATWYAPYGSAHFAMDDDPATAFYSRYGTLIALKSTTGTQKIPTRFEITAGTDTNNDWAAYGSITPKSYKLQGTNNWIDTEDAKYYSSTNWTTLAEYDTTEQPLAAGEVRSFDVVNAGAYTHFRLQAGASDHVNGWNGYASFKLFGFAPEEETEEVWTPPSGLL